MNEYSMLPISELVTGIVIMLLAASMTTIASQRLRSIPLTVLLVFIGIVLHQISDHFEPLEVLTHFELSPELVLFVFIPTLIFESAFNLDARQVGRNILPILTLAVPGLLISTAVIGSILAFLSPFDWLVALLIGAILSATDPVAVISIFKQLGVPERLTVLVEGESLFNDATSLVLASLLIGLLASHEVSAGVIGEGVIEFFVVFLGGSLVGWLLAVIVGEVLGSVESNPAIEITLSTILAYFSFIIAEHVFHVSGIMAVVSAGMVIGSWGKSKISPSIEEFMSHFWEYLAYLANAMIFLMVGMQIDLIALWQHADLIGLVFFAMLVSRGIVVFGVVPVLARFPQIEPIGMPYQMVMYWGGLRGAIALAIVLSLPEFQGREEMIAIVMGAVLATLVIQGLSIEWLVKKLGLDKPSLTDDLAQIEGDLRAKTEGLSRLDRLTASGMFSDRISKNIREKGERDVALLKSEIKQLRRKLTVEEMRLTVATRCLGREKARYHELFSRGLVNEWAYRELIHTINVQLDSVRHDGLLPSEVIDQSISKRLSLIFLFLLDHTPGFDRTAEKLRTQWIIRDYGVAWARHRGATTVLEELETLGGQEVSEAVLTEIRSAYEKILSHTRDQIDEVAELYPEFVETMQEQLGQRLMVSAEHDSVSQATESGLLPGGVGDRLIKAQAERLRVLTRDNMSACFEIEVAELLRKVPLFSRVPTDQYQLIEARLKVRTVPAGTIIIRQGQTGSSMFLIARGIARVSIEEEGISKDVAILYAGDFFGESALLHEAPRNATATALTPCSLYELRRADLETLCEEYPEIREGVEEVDQARLNENRSD